MSLSVAKQRQSAITDLKRSLILDAASAVFAEDGMDGASLRAIAKRAGYTAGAIYSYFESKEDIYGALLDRSLDELVAHVTASVSDDDDAEIRVRNTGQAFFDFYAGRPRDLDLGFYLFRGGLRPQGLGPRWDNDLNEKLLWALAPVREALHDLGCNEALADTETAAYFAHVSGLLLLMHTGRMRLFGATGPDLLASYLDDLIHRIARAVAASAWQNAHDAHG